MHVRNLTAVMVMLLVLGGCAPGRQVADSKQASTEAAFAAEAASNAAVKAANDIPPADDSDQADYGFSEAEKSECEARGGDYRRVGMAGFFDCITPYADAGKSCKKSSDCEGDCRVKFNADKGTSGSCQINTHGFGCYAYLDDNGEKLAICVD